MGAAITSGAGSGQNRFLSLIEAGANVVVGYVLAIATQIVVFPRFGIETGLTEHLTIGMAFVLVSLARGYLLRRLFERIRVASHSGARGGHAEPAQTRR